MHSSSQSGVSPLVTTVSFPTMLSTHSPDFWSFYFLPMAELIQPWEELSRFSLLFLSCLFNRSLLLSPIYKNLYKNTLATPRASRTRTRMSILHREVWYHSPFRGAWSSPAPSVVENSGEYPLRSHSENPGSVRENRSIETSCTLCL